MYTIKRDSWHYRMASFGSLHAAEQQYLSGYAWLVFKGICSYFSVMFWVSLLVLCNALGIADAINGIWIVNGSLSELAVINVATVLIPVLIFVGWGVMALIDAVKRSCRMRITYSD